MKEPSIRLTRRCSAPPEALYDTLADLGTHLTWGGAKQWYNFRLRSLDAPAGPAAAGTSFTSTGTIPMTMRRFNDRSTVTVAQRPAMFEFVTESTVRRGRRQMAATYRHRYEITTVPGGSSATYTMTELGASNPFLRLSLPGIRNITWRVAIPFMAGRGFRNLVAGAERSATHESTPQLAGHPNS